MEIVSTGIDGLIEILPQVFGDHRGYFFEAYHKNKFAEAGIPVDFVQDNQSFSGPNVLRGLHFQEGAYAQGKLVRVIKGKVLDVAVDLRENSPTFGHHYKCILDDQKQNMLYVPEGFAHGFLTLEEAIFFYKCTNYYHKAAENGIMWNDPILNIDWGTIDPKISEKDQVLQSFTDYCNSLKL
ncbi:MAG: dTDP-4-dehydrorhamnose 3,5-epimerase [Cyclobacteriaceae bacterium]